MTNCKDRPNHNMFTSCFSFAISFFWGGMTLKNKLQSLLTEPPPPQKKTYLHQIYAYPHNSSFCPHFPAHFGITQGFLLRQMLYILERFMA